MVSTVHPDRKLMVATSRTPTASNAGLMMTPPPIPQIAPCNGSAKADDQKDQIHHKIHNYLPNPFFFIL